MKMKLSELAFTVVESIVHAQNLTLKYQFKL